ncbi:MAG: M14 family zinc carboxypeptidase, partial [Bacteroidota bacterium]
KTSDTYRGTAAFSEPEIQAVRDLCNAHQFQLALNYHSYGDLLIHPYGYVNQLTPDDPTFKAFGRTMTRENNYFVGTGTETVGYLVNGDSDDWMYGEQTTKPKIYSMTPEAGPNFWPPASQIQEVNRACLRQNMVTAHLVHSFVEWEENGPFSLPTTNGQFKLELQQYGLQAGGVDVSVSALSSNINLTFSTQSVNLSHLQTQDLIIPYQVIPSGTSVVEEIEIAVTLDYGSFSETQKITRQYLTGSQGITFSEDGQNLQNWEVNGDWGTTTVWYTSAPSSFTDSPVGQYAANDENTMELEKAVDLSQADYAVLRFQSRWDIENNFDYGQVLASSDGVNFSPLCGQYTNEGTQYQDQGEPVFDGQQADWVEESMDLSEYLGDSLYLRFLLKSDGFVEGDGWYIDDLEVETYSAGPTGIENDWRKMWQDIKVFPQPAEGLLNLSFTNIQHLANMKISFWDMTGRKLGEEQLGALPAGPQQLSWDISAWKDGLYFLYLETDQGYRHMLKVVKK